MKSLLAVAVVIGCWFSAMETANAQKITDKVLLDNEWVTVTEVTFPPGVAGDAHPTPAPEIGYVLEGALIVTTMTEGKSVQKAGEIKWIPADVIHKVQNDERRPARVLVINLKKRP
ncbi:MAG TPA: cupin domain-containing protein [Methylomirabilota bacterium]|nr:cupin domain-containing protein [Methylomirabilota bacterium]